MDGFLFRPVEAGLWRHKEAIDGTYSFNDLVDAHELLDVRRQNEVAYAEWTKEHPEG